MVDEAKKLASDPKTRAKIDEARQKLTHRGGAGHTPPAGTGTTPPASDPQTGGPTKPPAV
jgi:hypothetical protein